MPRTPLPAELASALRGPHQCVVATVRTNGDLSTAATWYEFSDDGHILLNMDASRARMKHLRADPRVALTVFPGENWYSHLSLSGRVIEFRKDEDLSDVDRISRLYTGEPYPDRERDSWTAVVEITQWHAWGALAGK